MKKFMVILIGFVILFAGVETAGGQSLINARRSAVKKRAAYAPPPVAVAPSQLKPIKVEAVKERRELALKKSRGMEVALSAGLIASIPGVKLELQSNFPYGELKYGAAYAQGEDSNNVNRKHALVFLDVSRRFAPAVYQGIRPYWSVGINYDAYTSGRVSGALGWQCALGMEGDITASSFYFLDLGYGVINTGFSPIYNGLTAQLGYRALL